MALFIATVGGVGYVPVAPGTAGSLLALGMLWVLSLSPLGLALLLLAVVVVGGWASGRAERLIGRKDPSSVVVDEVAGMVLSVLALPRELVLFLAAFFLFRVLDILKPFPARQSQALVGGPGIMLDDLVAGAYTLAVVWGLQALLGGRG
ncbi:MAG: phosphatidylglycerophosphatase A [Candidatus Methylomirabilia bacterium]